MGLPATPPLLPPLLPPPMPIVPKPPAGLLSEEKGMLPYWALWGEGMTFAEEE